MNQSVVRFNRLSESDNRSVSLRQGSPITSIGNQKVFFTQKDLNQIFDMICMKGHRLFTLFSNNKPVLDSFRVRHLQNNVFMKIALHQVLYELSNQRKIGKNLKGLSKLLLQQIENKLWDVISIEVKLMHRQEEIRKCQKVFREGQNQLFKLGC